MREILFGQAQTAPVQSLIGFGENRPVILAAMVILGLLGLAAFALIYYRKRRLQKTVEAQFKEFRERAVSLMDQLDALRQRHKTLPATDPDFTVAMSGATLAQYNEVSHDLDRLWERWLKVMEIWEQAQWRIRAGSGLGVKPTEEVQKLLGGGELDELVRQSASCKQRLDQLNQAHERALEDLKAAREELAAIQSKISKGTGVLLPSDPHHREIEAAEQVFARAEQMIAADPIGAHESIVRARRELATVGGRPDGRTAWRGAEPPSAYSMIDELATAAERFRSAASRLRLTDLLGLFVRAWIAVWVVGILFSLLTSLLPLVIFFGGFLVILIGAGIFFRAVGSWFFFGLRR